MIPFLQFGKALEIWYSAAKSSHANSFRNRVVFSIRKSSSSLRRASLHGQDLPSAVSCGKIHLGSIRCCMLVACPASEGM